MENVFVEIVNVWLIFTQTKDVVSLRLYFYSIMLILMSQRVHPYIARKIVDKTIGFNYISQTRCSQGRLQTPS